MYVCISKQGVQCATCMQGCRVRDEPMEHRGAHWSSKSWPRVRSAPARVRLDSGLFETVSVCVDLVSVCAPVFTTSRPTCRAPCAPRRNRRSGRPSISISLWPPTRSGEPRVAVLGIDRARPAPGLGAQGVHERDPMSCRGGGPRSRCRSSVRLPTTRCGQEQHKRRPHCDSQPSRVREQHKVPAVVCNRRLHPHTSPLATT